MRQRYRAAHIAPLTRRWYFPAAILLLVVAAFFRLWALRTTPPGISTEELINAELADHMRAGDVSILYDQVAPAREGMYPALLAATTTITGRGLLMWRFPSVWIGLLSLAVTASLMKRLFGVRIALMTLGVMAVSFWSVWIGRAALHVVLMPLFTALTLYLTTRAYLATDQTASILWYTAAGLVLGLAQYAHVTAWTLIILPVAFVIYRWALNRTEIQRHWLNIFYALALFAILIIPMAIFLAKHPGVRAPVPAAGDGFTLLDIPQRFLGSFAGLGLSGDVFPNHNLPGHPLLGPILSLLMVIGLGMAAAWWRHPAYGLALLWIMIGMLPTAFAPRVSDFEYMVVAMPIAFALPAIGLHGLYGLLRRLSGKHPLLGRMLPAFGGVVALLVILTGIGTYQDYFVVWPHLDEVRQNYQADLSALVEYLNTDTDPTPVVICAPPVDQTEHPFALTNDQLLDYLMYRYDPNLRYFDCTQSLLFINGGETERVIFPRGHYYDQMPGPLLAWMAYAQPVDVPGVSPDTILRINVSKQLADTAGAFTTTAPAAWPPESGEFSLAPLPVSFGHNVTFLGYTIRDETLQPSDYLELTTYWRLDGPPPPELTMFAHLLGSSVVVLAQNDHLGVNVAQLQTRDVFIEYSLLQTPPGISPGLYPVSVGLYLPSSGERLQVFEKETAKGDRLFLKRITISPSQ